MEKELFEILVQERTIAADPGLHCELFLLRENAIEARIHFLPQQGCDRLHVAPSSAPKGRGFNRNKYAVHSYFLGADTAAHVLWQKASLAALRISQANIQYEHNALVSCFNCRAGVVGCLWAMGYDYISPKGMNVKTGTLPCFGNVGIDLYRP